MAAPQGAVFAISQAEDDSPGQTVASEAEPQTVNQTAESVGVYALDEKISYIPDQQELGLETDLTTEVDQATIETADAPLVKPIDKHLVISYVQASGIYGKFIEIQNVSSSDYQTRMLSVQFIKASDINGGSPEVLASFYGTIPAGGKVVIGDQTIKSTGQSADRYFQTDSATIMSPDGGMLILVDGTSELDRFCWAKDNKKVCADDYYHAIPLTKDVAYARCFGQTAILCANGLEYEEVSRKLAESANQFIPFINTCSGIEVSEVAPRLADPFIELHNLTDSSISLEMCTLQSNSKTYQFSDLDKIEPGQYLSLNPESFNLSLAKTTPGFVRIISTEGEVVDSLNYDTPKDNRSAIRIDGVVVWTLTSTVGEKNIYLKLAPCADGYVMNEDTERCNKIAIEPATAVDCGEGRERNPATGRCRNIPTIKEFSPCADGQYRSEETNRCRSIASVAASVLKPCADDQFRNPETNRCKNIASTEELVDCGEGRERNPDTNRCRNIQSSAMPVAGFAPEPVKLATEGVLGWWVLGGVSLLAVGYAGWQWRFEASRLFRKIHSIVSSGRKQ